MIAGKKCWLWITLNKEEHDRVQWLRIIEDLLEIGIDALNLSGKLQILKQLLPITKDYPMEIHAWIFSLISNDKLMIDEHPECFMINREGISSLVKPPYVDYYHWLCPNQPGTAEYLISKIERCLEIPEFAGIHLDYIRYPDVILPVACQKKYGLNQINEEAKYDFCYCSYCREKYLQKFGSDPLDLPDPAKNEYWLKFRYDSINALVEKLTGLIRGGGKSITAAVFPNPQIARELVRQDWTAWDLDGIFPMIYHNFYDEQVEWIGEVVREDISAITGRFPLYSGLYLPGFPGKDLQEAINISLKNGADGIAFFDYRSLKSGMHLSSPVKS